MALTLKKVEAKKGTRLQVESDGKDVGVLWLRDDVDPKNVTLTVKS